MSMQPWEGRDRLVAIDIETTGRRLPSLQDIRKAPKGLRQPGIIIEIGCLEIIREGDGWRKARSWESRVNPDAPLHPDAIKVHGIKPADLKAAPRFPEVADALLAFLGEDLLVAHAYENEMDFLNYEFARCGRAAWGSDTFSADRFICTKEMSHEVFPGASGSLDALCDRLWLDRSDRFAHHGALLDADLTADAFVKMALGDTGPRGVVYE
ncbi:DNA polymerase III subunit epsilon [Azospirillum sp. B21]|uniref:3'-5' exonuclease n=1 Tax=Azospirillum sp. B21 TaxID=2607496 RepID=UPI0011EC16E1|nr:exonuclease domain-containing protein [Azospirillum sp. B21]KAA0574352.1 DNA polymerase III subunit epsilon [Azospirillum sp. B21]